MRYSIASKIKPILILYHRTEVCKTEEYEKYPELLKEKCKKAIAQIKQKQYDIDLIGNTIYVALAHSGKDVEMVWKEMSID